MSPTKKKTFSNQHLFIASGSFPSVFFYIARKIISAYSHLSRHFALLHITPPPRPVSLAPSPLLTLLGTQFQQSHHCCISLARKTNKRTARIEHRATRSTRELMERMWVGLFLVWETSSSFLHYTHMAGDVLWRLFNKIHTHVVSLGWWFSKHLLWWFFGKGRLMVGAGPSFHSMVDGAAIVLWRRLGLS